MAEKLESHAMTGNREILGEMGKAPQNTEGAELLKALNRGSKTLPPPVQPKASPDCDFERAGGMFLMPRYVFNPAGDDV
jgi:hypothetical protein